MEQKPKEVEAEDLPLDPVQVDGIERALDQCADSGQYVVAVFRIWDGNVECTCTHRRWPRTDFEIAARQFNNYCRQWLPKKTESLDLSGLPISDLVRRQVNVEQDHKEVGNGHSVEPGRELPVGEG